MRRLLMMALLLSMVVMPGLISAQVDDFVCNLDEADCELLENTLTAMVNAQTANADTFNFDFTLDTSNSIDSVSFAGNGPISFAGPNGIELDMTLDEFTAETDNLPLESGATALRIVDGVTYTLNGESWVAYESDVAGLSELYSPANLLAMAVNLSDTAEWTRGEDIEVDGRTLYVYTADIRFGDILGSEEFTDLMDSQLEGGNVPGAEGVPTELVGLMMGLLARQLNEGTTQFTFHISPEDNLVYGTVVDIDIELDFEEMLGAFVGAEAGNLPVITTDFDLTMTLSNYDQAVVIEAPADAVAGEPISLADALLNGMLGSSNGGGGINVGGGNQFDPSAVDGALVAGEEITGTLTIEDDSQYYRFTASAGDIVTISLYATSDDSDLDTYLRLYDASGMALIENDDAEDNSALGFFDSEITHFEIPADGEYFVEATWLFTSPDGAYGLTLTFEE